MASSADAIVDCLKQVFRFFIFEPGNFICQYLQIELLPPRRTSDVNLSAMRLNTEFRGPFKVGFEALVYIL